MSRTLSNKARKQLFDNGVNVAKIAAKERRTAKGLSVDSGKRTRGKSNRKGRR